MAMSNSVKAAVIGAVALVLAAAVTAALNPSWWRHDAVTGGTFTIAGTVVDQSSNRSVGQALISVDGRTETYVTEDNGNFRFDLRGELPSDGTVRIRVAKTGYLPYDHTTGPTERLTVVLRKK
jgi:hypothetical protein